MRLHIQDSKAWDAFLSWYGPQTAAAKSDLSRRVSRFQLAPERNSLGAMGRIEDSAADIRTERVTHGDHMQYTIFIDALPAEHIVEGLSTINRRIVRCELTLTLVQSVLQLSGGIVR